MNEGKTLYSLNIDDGSFDESDQQYAAWMIGATGAGLVAAIGALVATKNPSIAEKVFTVTMETGVSAPFGLTALCTHPVLSFHGTAGKLMSSY